MELDAPVLTEASRRGQLHQRAGVDGTVRYLRNVMGLWLLQESLRTWAAAGCPPTWPSCSPRAAAVPAVRAPSSTPTTPRSCPRATCPRASPSACRRDRADAAGRRQAETVRCILDSLALAYRARRPPAPRSSPAGDVDVVHVVGGGARNALLCQLTADACGLPVLAGPVEATALGNVLVQARAPGASSRGTARDAALLRATQDPRLYLSDAGRRSLLAQCGGAPPVGVLRMLGGCVATPAAGVNWAGNHRYPAETLHRPASVEQLQELVAAGRERARARVAALVQRHRRRRPS